MKNLGKVFGTFLLASLFVVPVVVGCDSEESGGAPEVVDYVGKLHLDMTSATKKQEVTVRLFIDGDTTHFDPVKDSKLTGYNAADFEATYGYIKARYLAVNTPESTGDVEKWGKTASNFTHDKLASAESIIVESDSEIWNMDSNDRYTLWIWYKPVGGEYRNLNVELLQNGYGLAQNTETNRYGKEYALPALMQAKAQKLKIYSDDVDENYYEGDSYNISLKKLRCYIDNYVTKRVRVEGYVTTQIGESVYIEDYDEETGLSFGIVVYYGYSPGSKLREVLTIGNRVSVDGVVSYSEGFGYQISGVSNNAFHPEYTTNTVVVEKDGKPVTGEGRFAEQEIGEFLTGKTEVGFTETVTDENGESQEKYETVTLDYGQAILNTTASFKNLKVKSMYTTKTGESTGAISLYCRQLDDSGNEVGQQEVVIRTEVLRDKNGELVTEDLFRNKVIDVKGIVDVYNGSYQLRVHLLDYFTIH